MGAPPHVVVIVLSYNGREDTLACLRSLGRVAEPRPTLIVVDNASADGSADAVARAFPDVELLRLGENCGYAGGMNAGIRRALELGADDVVLLNNDTEVDPGFLAPLLAAAKGAGAVCAKVLFADPPGRIWFAGADYDPRRGHQGRHAGHLALDGPRFDGVWPTGRACGAAMLVPRAALERVGLLDDDLFAYAEDVEWSLRARQAGLPLLVAGGSRVWHKVSATSGGAGSPTSLYYTLRNSLVSAERHAPLDPLGTWRRRVVATAATLAQALVGGAGGRRERVRAVSDGLRDAVSGRLGPRDRS